MLRFEPFKVTQARVKLGSKINRVAGRVIENPSVSVTIDELMIRISSYRANGSDREECGRWEDRCPHPTPNLWGAAALRNLN